MDTDVEEIKYENIQTFQAFLPNKNQCYLSTLIQK